MAEGGSLPRCDEDFLTCILCLDLFSDPRTLPCLHTFCHKCLSALLSKNYSSPNNQKFKCPFCNEAHSIPSNGASGFRQDFRIKTLIDKMEASSTGSKSDGAMCKRHPQLPLDYYCTNARCKRAICKTCWTTDHQSHIVTPIVVDNGTVNNEIGICRDLLETNIKEIIVAKEMLSKSTREANDKIHKAFHKSHEVLISFEDKLMGTVKEHSKIEMDKLKSELDACLNLQEELNPKNLSNKTTKEQALYIKKVKENAASWNLIYSKPSIKGEALSKVDFLTIEYQNEALGKKVENGPVDMMKSVRISASAEHNESQVKQNDPAKEKSDTPTPNDHQGPAVLHIPSIQLHDPQEPDVLRFPSIRLHNHQELDVLHFPSVRLHSNLSNDILMKDTSLDSRRFKVHYMTFSPDHGLFLVQDNFMRGYGENPFRIPLKQRPWYPNGPVDILRCGRLDCLVEFDLKNGELRFFPAQRGPFPFQHSTANLKCKKQQISFSCIGGFVLYSHIKNGFTFVTALCATHRFPPNVIWTHCVPVAKMGPVCAAIDEQGSPFLVCVDLGSGIALRAVSDKACNEDNTLWVVTCLQLDSHALDIIDIVFDGKQFFVLNRCGNESCLYVVSKNGHPRGKVGINSQPLSIKGARKMAADQEFGQLFIATEDHMVHVFQVQYHY